jgi:hypothetical protein
LILKDASYLLIVSWPYCLTRLPSYQMQSRFEALENYTEEEEVVLIRNLYRPRANAEIEGVKIAPAAQEMAGVGVLLRYNRVMSVTKACHGL